MAKIGENPATQTGPATGETPDFEQALAELESVVERLEQGELPLEEALRQFERGIALARSCQQALKQAEQKVEILLAKTLDSAPEPFEPDDLDS